MKQTIAQFILTAMILPVMLDCVVVQRMDAHIPAWLKSYPHSAAVARNTSLLKTSDDTLSLVGQWGWGECGTIVVRGNYAFIGNGTLLQIYDINDPYHPYEVGEVQVPSPIEGLAIDGNYAYTVLNFFVIDISDVAHPQLVGGVIIPTGLTGAIAIDSTYAFVGDLTGYIYTIDFSNRAHPVIKNRSIATQGGLVVSLVVVDTMLYASSGEGTQTDIFDISNILNPIHILPSYPFGYRGPLAREGNYLCLGAGTPYFQFWLYDISKRSTPRYIGGTSLRAYPISISIKDTLAFVWENWAGFEVVDIADTSNIFVLAQVPYIFNFPSGAYIGPVSGDFASSVAYIPSINGLWILDVGNLPKATTVSFMETGGFEVTSMATDSLHHAFLAESYSGLKILDISDPSAPKLAGHYEPTDEAIQDVVVSGDKAYLSCDRDLVILDVSKISNPKEVGRVAFDDTLNVDNGYTQLCRLAICDSTVYVVRTSNRLYSIDVSDPSTPTIKTVMQTKGAPTSITKVNGYLYVAIADLGVQVFNATSSPGLSEAGIAKFDAIGGISISNGELFALTDSGFTEYKLLDSLNLQYVGSCALPIPFTYDSEIKIAGGYAYVCYGNYFEIINIVNQAPSITFVLDGSRFSSFARLDNLVLIAQEGNSLLVFRSDLISKVEAGPIQPKDFVLYQNYPNPFNPTTIISYQLQSAGRVLLKVYDVLGREVAVLVNVRQQGGTYSVEMSGARIASGVYFYTLNVNGITVTKKMELIR